jgi:hypothetical protein
MNMTLETNRNPHLSDLPWIQKARPGVRRAKAAKPAEPAHLSTSLAFHHSFSNHDTITGVTMSNEARKQRLLHEAIGNAGDEIPMGEIAALSVTITALILFAAIALAGCNWDERKILVVSTNDRAVATAHQDSAPRTSASPTGTAEPGSNTMPLGGSSRNAADGNVQDLTY